MPPPRAQWTSALLCQHNLLLDPCFSLHTAGRLVVLSGLGGARLYTAPPELTDDSLWVAARRFGSGSSHCKSMPLPWLEPAGRIKGTRRCRLSPKTCATIKGSGLSQSGETTKARTVKAEGEGFPASWEQLTAPGWPDPGPRSLLYAWKAVLSNGVNRQWVQTRVHESAGGKYNQCPSIAGGGEPIL